MWIPDLGILGISNSQFTRETPKPYIPNPKSQTLNSKPLESLNPEPPGSVIEVGRPSPQTLETGSVP